MTEAFQPRSLRASTMQQRIPRTNPPLTQDDYKRLMNTDLTNLVQPFEANNFFNTTSNVAPFQGRTLRPSTMQQRSNNLTQNQNNNQPQPALRRSNRRSTRSTSIDEGQDESKEDQDINPSQSTSRRSKRPQVLSPVSNSATPRPNLGTDADIIAKGLYDRALQTFNINDLKMMNEQELANLIFMIDDSVTLEPLIYKLIREHSGIPTLTADQIQANTMFISEVTRAFVRLIFTCKAIKIPPRIGPNFVQVAARNIFEGLPIYVTDDRTWQQYSSHCPDIADWVQYGIQQNVWRKDQRNTASLTLYNEVLNLIHTDNGPLTQFQNQRQANNGISINPPTNTSIIAPLQPEERKRNDRAPPVILPPSRSMGLNTVDNDNNFNSDIKNGDFVSNDRSERNPRSNFVDQKQNSRNSFNGNLIQDNSTNPKPLYFDTQYLPPMLDQFTQEVRTDRQKGASRAGVDSRLLAQLDQLQIDNTRANNDLTQANDQIDSLNKQLLRAQADFEQKIEAKARPVIQTMVDPLYSYYTQYFPEGYDAGSNMQQFPLYGYFMGLSQIMLEAIGDIARLLSQSCNQRIGQRYSNARVQSGQAMVLFQECKNDAITRFQQLIQTNIKPTSTVSTLRDVLVTFLNQISTDQDFNRDVTNRLFLLQEIKDENIVRDSLTADLNEARNHVNSLNNRAASNEIKASGREVVAEIEEELAQSNLRTQLISQIQSNTLNLLQQLFVQQSISAPVNNNKGAARQSSRSSSVLA